MSIIKLTTIFSIVITALSSCSSGSQKAENQTDTLAVEPTQPSIPARPTDIIISKNDTGKAEAISFMVKNTSEPTIDRSGYSVTKPEDNQKYIAVQVWIKNTSTKDISLGRDDFKLLDQDGAEFVEVPGFTEHRRKPILFDHPTDLLTLKPNQVVSGWVTYTVDINSRASKITYQNITVNL